MRQPWFQAWASDGVSETVQFGRLILTFWLCWYYWRVGRTIHHVRTYTAGYQFGLIQVDWWRG